MKIMAFIGSPRKDGNTSKIVHSICKGSKESGHEVEIYNLFELDNKGCVGCNACQKKEVDFCSIDDKLTTLLPKMAEADCIIIGTAIYVGQAHGCTKNFIDRLSTFSQDNHTVQKLSKKKYVTVTCNGTPAENFKSVTEYLNRWLGGFFKMENVGNIIAGSLGRINKDAIDEQPEILKQAENIGRKLKC